MSEVDQAHKAEDAPSPLHRLLDWSIFPASVAAASVVGFSLLFAAVTGRRPNSELPEAAVAAVSALIAASVKRKT